MILVTDITSNKSWVCSLISLYYEVEMKSVTVSGNNTKQFQGQGRVQGSARNNKNQRESQAVGVTENIRLIVATLNTNTR